MWVFLNDAFLSAVQHRNKPDSLMIRARFRHDLQTVFPDLEDQVQETPSADYRFRVVVTKERFMQQMIEEIGRIDYANFKGSVQDVARHDVYLQVWNVMFRAQQDRYGNPRAERDTRTRDMLDDAFL